MATSMNDSLEELLGIDASDESQGLAIKLVDEMQSLIVDLKYARRKSGLSDEELALMLDCSIDRLYEFEDDLYAARLSQVVRYAHALKVELEITSWIN